MMNLLQSYGSDLDIYASGQAEIPGWAYGVYGVFLILYLVCNWRIYTKSGEPGWASLVPVYNLYVWCRMIKKPKLFTRLLLALGGYLVGIILIMVSGAIGGILVAVAAIALIVFSVQMVHGLSKAFGQDVGFTLGLLFLGFIFLPLLAFGNYDYVLNDETPAVSDSGVLDS